MTKTSNTFENETRDKSYVFEERATKSIQFVSCLSVEPNGKPFASLEGISI